VASNSSTTRRSRRIRTLFLERDATGKSYESRDRVEAGSDVVLTIDQSIQYQAEQALNAAMQRSHAKVRNGDRARSEERRDLALANAPSFDPNNVRGDESRTRSNWALQNIYEPGSTFKVVAFSAALERNSSRLTIGSICQMGAITGRRPRGPRS
jgi:cell division protein FtsI (penicillin-binding protein 3)